MRSSRRWQRNTFQYFWQETNPSNGLIPDNTSAGGVPASIAGVGLGLTSYPVGVERSFVARAQAVERTLATLRVFWNAPHGPMPDATGHRGFFYHFLDVTTGRRARRSELSTLDTTTVLFDQWIRLFLRCQRCEHLWSEGKPDTDE